MNNFESQKEFRLKSGSKILDLIKKFSITEKTIFGILVIIVIISTLFMIQRINDFFMIEIPTHGGELREGVIGLPHTINPVLSITDVDRDLTSLIYSGLMKYDGENLTTDLAESFDISEDGLTYTFKIRPNVYFHDNRPLTAEDVAFTIQKVQTPALKSPRRADWNNVTVSVISSEEIRFTLKQPYSPFINNTTIGIIPKHIWNDLNDDQFVFSEYNVKPIGAGPYKFNTIKRDADGIPEEINVKSWKKHQPRPPYIDSITFIFFPDSDKAISAIEKGAIDSLVFTSPRQASGFLSDCTSNSSCKDKYSIISTPLSRIFGVFFNQSNNPVLADRIVRQALDISIDKKMLTQKILNGYGIPVYGPLPKIENSAEKIQVESPNMALATSILEKAGWKKNSQSGIYEKKNSKNVLQILSFDIFTADTPDLKETAFVVRDTWNALGAQVNVKIFESGELYQNIIRPRKYDALLFGQQIGKDRDLYAFWHSSQRNSPGLNVSLYTNSKADSLLDTIRSTNDKDLLKSKYAELDTIIKADIPAVFLYSPSFIYLTPSSLKNMNADFKLKNISTQTDRWNSVSDWFITTEKVWKMFAK